MSKVTAIAVLGFVMLSGPLSAEPPATGYKVGSRVVPLLPEYRVTGPRAGQTANLICTYAYQPLVVVYTRELNAPVIRLIKKVDETTAAHRKHPSPTYFENLGSYVTLVCDKQEREADLKALAEKEKIAHTTLALVVLNDAIRRDAANRGVTWAREFDEKFGAETETVVLVAFRATVKTSFVYRKGDLTDKESDRILADVPKLMKKD